MCVHHLPPSKINCNRCITCIYLLTLNDKASDISIAIYLDRWEVGDTHDTIFYINLMVDANYYLKV